jgi:protoheme IX farnesyltransferase
VRAFFPAPASFYDNIEVMSGRFRLAKVPLCLLIGCSTLFGYILAEPELSLTMWSIGFGVFVLATGAASLNSLQEYRHDGEMERTKNRPLPKGLLTIRQAGLQALVLLMAGLAIIFSATGTSLPMVTGAGAVVLYNCIYTPLKAKTVLAIVPGAICGAIPPYIGWLGGGGGAVSPTAALLVTLFVLWQVPHYWLVLLSFQADYTKSKMPSLLNQFQENSLKRFFVTWIGALVTVMLMFMVLPSYLAWPFSLVLSVNSCLLLSAFVYGLAVRKKSNYRVLFVSLNLALFMHMAIVALGRMVA